MIGALQETIAALDKLEKSFHDGKKLRHTPQVALIGRPNVGKSSLMNALLEKERAIVTAIAGTTRDVIEEACLIGGFEFSLVDTAGLRDTDEVIEGGGIRRSLETMGNADLVLLVLDATTPFSAEEKILLERCDSEKTLVVINKIDAAPPPPPFEFETETVTVSARNKTGMDSLKKAITNRLTTGSGGYDEVVLTKERHFHAVQRAKVDLSHALELLSCSSDYDLIAIEMRAGANALSSIIGMNITEELLSAIFSKFCVGK